MMEYEKMTTDELQARRKELALIVDSTRIEIRAINAIISARETAQNIQNIVSSLSEDEKKALQNMVQSQSMSMSGIESESKVGEPGK